MRTLSVAVFHIVVQLRAETFEACPHETDPSFDVEREVNVFVGNAAEV